VTVEDHWAEGGLGDAVLDALAVDDTRVVKLAVRNMPGSATPSEQLQSAGIDATHIVDAALDLIGRPGIRRHTGQPTGEWAAAAEEFEGR
jgi:transketolase